MQNKWIAEHPEEAYLYHARYREALHIYAREALHAGSCFVCGRIRSLRFHHLSYRNGRYHNPDGQAVHNVWRTLKEVETDPQNFRLLCGSCHTIVTRLSNHPDMIARLLELLKK